MLVRTAGSCVRQFAKNVHNKPYHAYQAIYRRSTILLSGAIDNSQYYTGPVFHYSARADIHGLVLMLSDQSEQFPYSHHLLFSPSPVLAASCCHQHLFSPPPILSHHYHLFSPSPILAVSYSHNFPPPPSPLSGHFSFPSCLL